MHTALIGVGSNIGDRIQKIRLALKMVNEDVNCKVVKTSSVYETKPYGIVEQENFLNAVFNLQTSYSIYELFTLLKGIEKKIGRKVTEKWGPREIDLDILFYDDVTFNDENLNIPHKDLQNRDFVLIPLNEIVPDFVHPVLDKKISEISIFENQRHIIRKIPEKLL